MNCNKCPFYQCSIFWNRCDITESEYFHTVKDCNFAKDVGTVNKEEVDKIFI